MDRHLPAEAVRVGDDRLGLLLGVLRGPRVVTLRDDPGGDALSMTLVMPIGGPLGITRGPGGRPHHDPSGCAPGATSDERAPVSWADALVTLDGHRAFDHSLDKVAESGWAIQAEDGFDLFFCCPPHGRSLFTRPNFIKPCRISGELRDVTIRIHS